MAIRNQLVHDQRSFSRLPVRVPCHFSYQGGEQPAMLVELSQASAKLSAKFMPSKGAAVTIGIEIPKLKTPLLLHGNVVRGTWGYSDHGEVCKFVVKFHRQAPELLLMLPH